ncbi:unnamed protein product [Meloidogyne enterolobii]|uniref:Uncharacterized protein n=1 Tax=Meloidogyne enterolobii TaxID=390850 RepID=A0ACB0ZE12_MELEN
MEFALNPPTNIQSVINFLGSNGYFRTLGVLMEEINMPNPIQQIPGPMWFRFAFLNASTSQNQACVRKKGKFSWHVKLVLGGDLL